MTGSPAAGDQPIEKLRAGSVPALEPVSDAGAMRVPIRNAGGITRCALRTLFRPEPVRMTDLRRTPEARGVIDRLDQLRVILPAMATEIAAARRDAARLRVENARLSRRIAELESASVHLPRR